MSFFQKWFKENIRNGLVAIFELFLWAEVRKTVWKRLFLTFFKSYPTWKKWQNNLILMMTEIGSRVFTSEYRIAYRVTYSSSLHLCPCMGIIPNVLNRSGPNSQRYGKHTTNPVSSMPCLAPLILDVICFIDESRTNFHNLYISSCLYRLATCSFLPTCLSYSAHL